MGDAVYALPSLRLDVEMSPQKAIPVVKVAFSDKGKRKRVRADPTVLKPIIQELVGRDARSLVEDPVLTTEPTRMLAKEQSLNLLLRVRTHYRSVAGSRRQMTLTERSKETLQAEHLKQSAEDLRILPKRKAIVSNSQESGKGGKKTTGKKTVTTVSNGSGGAGAGAGALPLVHRMQWMVVPEFLSEELWDRHQYSFSDIRKTLDAFPARVLWQLVISYNRSATNASSRICSDNDLRMTFGGKSTAIQKLLNVLKELHPDWSKRPAVTWNMFKLDDPNGDGEFYEVSDRHVPGLPVHRINRTTFDHLLGNLVFWPSANIMSRSNNNANLTSSQSIDKHLADSYYVLTGANAENHTESTNNETSGKLQISVTTKIAKSIFAWRNIHVVPLEINKSQDLLLVGRVVPWSVYVAAHGLPESLKSCPNFILAPDGYYALLDESFYFYAAKNIFQSNNTLATATSTTTPSTNNAGIFKVPLPKKPSLKRAKPSPTPSLFVPE